MKHEEDKPKPNKNVCLWKRERVDTEMMNVTLFWTPLNICF